VTLSAAITLSAQTKPGESYQNKANLSATRNFTQEVKLQYLQHSTASAKDGKYKINNINLQIYKISTMHVK